MAGDKPLKNQRIRADKKSRIAQERKEKKIFSATSRFNRISPRKLNLVANLVRGRYIDEADTILKAVPKRGAAMIMKTLKSAVSNATYYSRTNRINIDVPSLKIVRLQVNGGPTLKRIRPSSERRPYLIRKRFSHLYMEVQEVKHKEPKPAPQATAVKEQPTREEKQVKEEAKTVKKDNKVQVKPEEITKKDTVKKTVTKGGVKKVAGKKTGAGKTESKSKGRSKE